VLNDNGDIFYIGETNTITGQEYPSFCAHAGSTGFSYSGYKISTLEDQTNEIGDISKFISAFNYIEDKYGDVNQNRTITQTVIWTLLGAIKLDSDYFNASTLTDAEKAAVKDVIANSDGYTGSGKIVDLAYLHGVGTGDDLFNAQPQLVPLYAPVFNNTTIPMVGAMNVNVDVTKQHDVVNTTNYYTRDVQKYYTHDVQDFYTRDVQDFYTRDVQDFYTRNVQDFYVPTFEKKITNNNTGTLVSWVNSGNPVDGNILGGVLHNGMTYVSVNVADASKDGGINFDIADSSKGNNPNADIGYGYNVKIEGNQLIISFDNRLISANVGAVVSTAQFTGNPTSEVKHTQVGNGQTLKIDMPANYGDTIYLFVHFEGGISWYTTGQYEFTGWKLSNTVTGDYSLVKTETGEYQYVKTETGDYQYVKTVTGKNKYVKTVYGDNVLTNTETTTTTVHDDEYAANFDLTVYDENNNSVYATTISNNGQVNISNLAPGTYNCVLSGAGIENMTMPVVVTSGETASVSFTTVVNGDDVNTSSPDVVTDNNLPDVITDKVLPIKYSDNKLEDVYADNILTPGYSDNKLRNVYEGNKNPESSKSIEYGIYTPSR